MCFCKAERKRNAKEEKQQRFVAKLSKKPAHTRISRVLGRCHFATHRDPASSVFIFCNVSLLILHWSHDFVTIG